LRRSVLQADTVIFYDSDWNPAMDAQAQDRAHRIGQTREVHIYRLITEHTIEENILTKALQKRNLDVLVMDRGKFDASQGSRMSSDAALGTGSDVKDLYTKGGLRMILGVEDDENDAKALVQEAGGETKDAVLSTEQLENAMTSLEDADDVQALRGAQKEAAEELKEFDETVDLSKDTSEDASIPVPKSSIKQSTLPREGSGQADQKTEVDEIDKEFAAWQTKVGMNVSAIESTLTPTERYGLRFREEIDPFYSIFWINEYNRKLEAAEEKKNAVDIDEIERINAEDERRAFESGDLLGTNPTPEDLVRQRSLYQREKERLRANKLKRKLTGEDWECLQDGQTKLPFWYNKDTGEALWEKPDVLHKLESLDQAQRGGWAWLPQKPILGMLDFLSPYPDRMNCALVCRSWRRWATDIGFIKHVYPVELGAYSREDSKMEQNHYRTLRDAVEDAQPGDTVGTLLSSCVLGWLH
jgi:hypothetical protein